MRTPPAETLQVYAVGKQWMWKFQHLDGKSEINELHVPHGPAGAVTSPPRTCCTAFYFPAFRVKGRHSRPLQQLWFEATKIGRATICSAPSTAARSTPG